MDATASMKPGSASHCWVSFWSISQILIPSATSEALEAEEGSASSEEEYLVRRSQSSEWA